MTGGYPLRELTIEEIDKVQAAKFFIAAILSKITLSDINPLKKRVHLRYDYPADIKLGDAIYFRVKILVDSSDGKGVGDNYCHVYLMIDGFEKIRGCKNRSISSLQLPVDSRLIAGWLNTFKDNSVIELLNFTAQNINLITQNEYNAARRS